MKKFNKRRIEEHGNLIIFQKKLNGIESNIAVSRLYTVVQTNYKVYLVESRYIVNFSLKKCSCKMAFEFGYPYKHLCGVIIYLRQDPLNFIQKYFTISNYRISYAKSILPLCVKDFDRDNILPPETRRLRGRPRISRLQSAQEN